jgi:hypothetical protein
VIYKNPGLFRAWSPHLEKAYRYLDSMGYLRDAGVGFIFSLILIYLFKYGSTPQLNKITTTEYEKVGKNRYRKKKRNRGKKRPINKGRIHKNVSGNIVSSVDANRKLV